jgi:6-pyruvoyltetrahydropterin/6-carboxytetrahydropterin synthase
MIRLMREVRFFHTPAWEAPDKSVSNHWAGTGPQSCPPFWVVRVVVEGPADPYTGYVCDIKVLDDFVRTHVAPELSVPSVRASFDVAARAGKSAFGLLAGRMAQPLRLLSVQIRFSPFTFLTFQGGGDPMIQLTQTFEFSASHRLHCPGLGDEENHRLFGKCSNPHGHGHNYLLEVAIEIEPAATSLSLHELDRIVRAEVIERFDHKNLNLECAEFADLNPTVENIAQVIFDRLARGLEPLRLFNVRVWETAKTYAECSAATWTMPNGNTR